MTPEEIYQEALERQRQLDAAEAQQQAYLAKTRPYETYQLILHFFAMNGRCNPRSTCINRVGEVACYHPEDKEFAIYTLGEWQTAKNCGWKALSDGLNLAILRKNIPESEQYQLTDADIPAYPYAKPPYR